MILVDSSVWIDYFRNADTAQVELLDQLLGRQPLLLGDLILTEILQGIANDQQFNQVLKTLAAFKTITLGGDEIAVQAARNYRTLRALGITVRKTIDTLIATRCIADGLTLLHNDRDFLPFQQHLGLQVAYSVV